MELDILKQNTTWNDASASINNNFAKVRLALENGVEGAGEKEIYVGDEPPTDENITLWIDTDEEGEGVKVDDALSGNSVNPVQNKVITAKFESIENMIGDALTWLDDINGEVI